MATAIPEAPFDDFRSYLAAMEATGNLIRVAELDQSRYEATALAYRLVERYGVTRAPAFLVERLIQHDGSVIGPLVGNAYGPMAAEALAAGITPVTGDHHGMYRQTIQHFMRMSGYAGYPRIAPIEVSRDAAPVKEVVVTGDDVDLFALPFIKSNPADAGRYVSTGAVVTHDEKLGTNLGTYRCQIKTKNKLGLNAGREQDGGRMLLAARARGEKVAHVAIAVGADPMTWAASCAKLGAPTLSEYEIAGGLRGRAVDVVRAEDSDLLVPARAEIVIEGEVPLDAEEPEGPYGELYGYTGTGYDANFFVNVKTITHRTNPVGHNAFTGIERGFLQASSAAAQTGRYRSLIPGLVEIHLPSWTMPVHIVAIRKTKPGQGMAAGLTYGSSFSIAKVVIVVDDDVDIYSYDSVMAAVGARWQPGTDTTIVARTAGPHADPSLAIPDISSKAVIDATRKLPSENGPAHFAAYSRTLVDEAVPGIFDDIDARWSDLTGR